MRIRSGASALITPPLAIPLAFVALLTLAYAFPFFEVPWPFVDVYEVLLKAESLSWRATVVKAFTEGVEYRPFFMVLVKALYDWVGLNLWFYKVIVLIQFALIFGAVVAILRPSTMQRAIAACLAVGCVAGLHTTRVLFSFFPVAHHSLVTLIVLAVVALALQEQRRVHPALVFVVTLTGLLFIEFGLLIPPLLLVLWLMRAPNASPRVVAASWIALAVYVAIRWGIGVQDFGISHNETGIGFAMMDGKEIERVFGSAPWLFWGYNILANLFTVLFSEPRSGIYLFVRGVMRGATYPWMWVHVISSLATTIAIAWFLVERPSLEARDRQLVALGLAMMVLGSGLGLLYSRDRLGLPIGFGYAILLYVAVSYAFEHPPRAGLARAAMLVCLWVFGAAWLTRDAEAWCQLRDTVWERHLEWTDRFEELGGFTREQSPLLDHMRALALAKSGSSPRRDARWTYDWMERKATD